MQVYEIEAFKKACLQLFGIFPSKEKVKEFVQSSRLQEDAMTPMMFLLDVHQVIVCMKKEKFKDILPGYEATYSTGMYRNSKGEEIVTYRQVVDTTGVAFGRVFDGVWVCGSYIFTTTEIIRKIENTQREKIREDIEKVRRAEKEAIEKIARINHKDHLAPMFKEEEFYYKKSKHEDWQRNIKQTRR